MNRLTCALFVFMVTAIFTALDSKGQKRVTLSGYLRDASTGENLAGALIAVDGSSRHVLSNDYGFYSVTLPPGEYYFHYSYLGYQTADKHLRLAADTSVTIGLAPSINLMNEVVVNPPSGGQNTNRPVSISPLSINSVRLLPPLLGEADLIRSFQLLPGVSSLGDGASGFNVRGGGVDQNLVLQDEAPLYFTSHLFNLFSVANPDAVKDANLYKTEMPARYGGRLSSVLDTRLKDGNNKEWVFTGGLGIIASRITAEGPLVKDKSSVIVSARRSYTDLITRQMSDPDIRNNSVYFYDLSAKVNVTLSPKDRVFLSGYFGKDKIDADEIFLLQWGNGTGTLRWNHVFNPKLFLNTSLIYSDYKYRLGSQNNPTSSYLWYAGINDYTLKNGFSWYPDTRNTIYFGLESTIHKFIPGRAEPAGPESLYQPVKMPGQKARDNAFYWDHELNFSEAFAVEYGIRYSLFQSVADEETVVFDYQGPDGLRKEAVNASVYEKGESIRSYHNFQPRVSVKLYAGRQAAFKASFSRTTQNLHLISNTISTSPLDFWIPSSYNIKPETANQFSLGYFRNLHDNNYEVSLQTYYRQLFNQIDFIDGAETVMNENQLAEMLYGKGRAYGAEFYFKKYAGRLNGWLSYTLSRSERRFDGINNNSYFPAKYDKTHCLSLVGVYQLKPRISISGTYNYASGTPVTLPGDRFQIDGYPIQYNSGGTRNNFRIPDYHRLDLSATFKGKVRPGGRYTSELVVSLFNALNRRNTFSVYLRQNNSKPSDFEAVRFAMFGTVIPSVTWNFKF